MSCMHNNIFSLFVIMASRDRDRTPRRQWHRDRAEAAADERQRMYEKVEARRRQRLRDLVQRHMQIKADGGQISQHMVLERRALMSKSERQMEDSWGHLNLTATYERFRRYVMREDEEGRDIPIIHISEIEQIPELQPAGSSGATDAATEQWRQLQLFHAPPLPPPNHPPPETEKAHPAYHTQPQPQPMETDLETEHFSQAVYELAMESVRQLWDPKCWPPGARHCQTKPSESGLFAAEMRLRQWMQKLQQQQPMGSSSGWPAGGLALAAAQAAITHQRQQKPIGRCTCKYWLSGYCKYGSRCRFVHELPSDDEGLPCISFSYGGYCKYGRKCRYLHE